MMTKKYLLEAIEEYGNNQIETVREFQTGSKDRPLRECSEWYLESVLSDLRFRYGWK